MQKVVGLGWVRSPAAWGSAYAHVAALCQYSLVHQTYLSIIIRSSDSGRDHHSAQSSRVHVVCWGYCKKVVLILSSRHYCRALQLLSKLLLNVSQTFFCFQTKAHNLNNLKAHKGLNVFESYTAMSINKQTKRVVSLSLQEYITTYYYNTLLIHNTTV